MKVIEYIQLVCEQNHVSDMIDWLIQSEDDVYYADRHVSHPPEGIARSVACEAGLALLEQWLQELHNANSKKISASTPRLIIDNEWLSDLPDAPPPHVVLTLSKRQELIHSETTNGQFVDIRESPFHEWIGGRYPLIKVIKISPSAEHESLGCWVLQIEK